MMKISCEIFTKIWAAANAIHSKKPLDELIYMTIGGKDYIVTKIADSAFAGSGITSITIGNNVIVFRIRTPLRLSISPYSS